MSTNVPLLDPQTQLGVESHRRHNTNRGLDVITPGCRSCLPYSLDERNPTGLTWTLRHKTPGRELLLLLFVLTRTPVLSDPSQTYGRDASFSVSTCGTSPRLRSPTSRNRRVDTVSLLYHWSKVHRDSSSCYWVPFFGDPPSQPRLFFSIDPTTWLRGPSVPSFILE